MASDDWLVLTGSTCAKETFPTPLHQLGLLTQGWLGPWIHTVDANSDNTVCLPQQKSRFIRPGYIFKIFKCQVFMILCAVQPQRPGFWLIEVEPNMAFCCCSPFSSSFDTLCIEISVDLSSTRRFRPQNCCLLDVSSLLYHSSDCCKVITVLEILTQTRLAPTIMSR